MSNNILQYKVKSIPHVNSLGMFKGYSREVNILNTMESFRRFKKLLDASKENYGKHYKPGVSKHV